MVGAKPFMEQLQGGLLKSSQSNAALPEWIATTERHLARSHPLWLVNIHRRAASLSLGAGGSGSQRGRWEGGRDDGGVSLVMWPDYQHLVVNNGGRLVWIIVCCCFFFFILGCDNVSIFEAAGCRGPTMVSKGRSSQLKRVGFFSSFFHCAGLKQSAKGGGNYTYHRPFPITLCTLPAGTDPAVEKGSGGGPNNQKLAKIKKIQKNAPFEIWLVARFVNWKFRPLVSMWKTWAKMSKYIQYNTKTQN